jgi:hypothetical protein
MGLSGPLPPEQQPVDPQQKFVQVERFGEVVVDPVGQSLNLVFDVGLGGQDQYGDAFIFQANIAQHGQAVDAGQHDV